MTTKNGQNPKMIGSDKRHHWWNLFSKQKILEGGSQMLSGFEVFQEIISFC